MYINYYRLLGEPFGITPNPRFLFLSAAHREALAALVYGVSQRKGFISIIGEVGTGKTIILRAFLEGIDPEETTAISLLNPLASFDQIIEEILPGDFVGSTPDRFRTLQEWLIDEYRQGRNVVVAIDEAQCMSAETMERLRLLSNLETAEHKLIQVVLAGQPELERKLAQPKLRQFRQRIAVNAKIWPLNHSDSIAYINHRLSKVSQPDSQPIFTRLALSILARQAKGNPRRLNILCDSALVTGFSYQRRPIPWNVAWEGSNGSSRTIRSKHALVMRASIVAGIVVALALLATYVVQTPDKNTQTIQSSTFTRFVDEDLKIALAKADRNDSEIAELKPIVLPELRRRTVQVDLPMPIEGLVTENDLETIANSSVDDNTNRNSILESYLALIPEIVVVDQGDGLWQLCRDIYGNADTGIVQMVIDANPHLQNPNALVVGEEIIFPRLAIMGEPVSASSTRAIMRD